MAEDEGMEVVEEASTSASRAVVLHEDKKYYENAEEAYPGVETLVEEEDAQPLTTPIVAPPKRKDFAIEEKEQPATSYEPSYLAGLLGTPELVRNVAVAGNLHHGKTSFLDILVQQTHAPTRDWDAAANSRYTDSRKDEQEQGLSIKATALSMALPGSSGKHYAINMIDTPGHPNFIDEVTAAMRLCDGVVVVVDAIEGVAMQTVRVVRQAAREGLHVVLLINKLDRLVLELKLPPADAYHKLRHIIESFNDVVASAPWASSEPHPKVSPELGNVLFASALHGWCFTLETFAQAYVERFRSEQPARRERGLKLNPTDSERAAANFDAASFARKLWGDQYFHRTTRTFRRTAPPSGSGSGHRSFVEFILEPLYKIYSVVLGEDEQTVRDVLEGELNVRIRKPELRLDVGPLMRLALSRFLGRTTGFVDMLVRHLPPPSEGSRIKTELAYTGPANSAFAMASASCNADGPLLVHVTKLFSQSDAGRFDALGRVMSGTLHAGDSVKVMGEGFSPSDEEDMAVVVASRIWLPAARYRVEVQTAPAGSIVLIEGVDEIVMKTATITSADCGDDADEENGRAFIFRPLVFDTCSVMKVAVEPLNPAELPKMLEGLRKVNKSYPLSVTKKEESGEHTIVGTGELYLDCILHDLRELYADIEVKVSDPVVSFCETVSETSAVKCFARTPNKRNKITMIAEPLDAGLAEDIEAKLVRSDWGIGRIGEFFRTKYGWDVLAAKSLWAFGPDAQGPNVLLDDTLPGEADKMLLSSIKRSVVQGFQWGAREGPLCEEPVRGVKFKILGAEIAKEEILRGGVQIIPTARRVCYSAFLTASPRIMEPIFLAEIQTPQDCVQTIYSIISRRRGQIVSEEQCPGTPLQLLKATLPAIDSFGFETDLRTHTQGQAFCLQTFDHWAIVPGDPCDRSIVLRPLQQSPIEHLAREFMVKTRRRKGLSEDVTTAKFFDEELRAFIEPDAQQ